MHLLELKNIAKIYVSENNVAVGIRGVNASFDRGEFVAITGKSGSGKSTILNVLSGIDTYEEGEMYVEGKPTSHYSQKDFEEYREKYISFIFQDYNIIDSFTVLENVELALMNIIFDPVQRKKRALELIERVGLTPYKNNRGSKLSGGQKQRTVIARALAKDAPIILADEPTGNLDSKSGREIIELLESISEDKLVIVVTHNFDEVKDIATRHIRIFDGSIEFDHVLKETKKIKEEVNNSIYKGKTLQKALKLGFVRYKAMPKLSFFITILMFMCCMGLTYITAKFSNSYGPIQADLFNEIDGRLIVTKKDNTSISNDDYEILCKNTNANSVIKYDFLLERNQSLNIVDHYLTVKFKILKEDIKCDFGKMPEQDNEALLSLPIYLKKDVNKLEFPYTVKIENTTVSISGVTFYYDNTKLSELLISSKTLEKLSLSYLLNFGTTYESYIMYNKTSSKTTNEKTDNFTIMVDNSLPENSYSMIMPKYNFVNLNNELTYVNGNYTPNFVFLKFDQNLIFNSYNYYDSDMYAYNNMRYPIFTKELTKYTYIETPSQDNINLVMNSKDKYDTLIISKDIAYDIIDNYYLKDLYTQASLFFDSNYEASSYIKTLNDLGYNGYLSNLKKSLSADEVLLQVVVSMITFVMWVIFVIFVSLVLYLCTNKAMSSTKGDVAIMRSMGITAKIIKQSIIIQVLLCIIPALLLTSISFTVLYLIPTTNYYVCFLHFKDYLILIVLLLIICYRLSKSYIKLMFNKSVKSSLKGGIKG